MIITRIKGSNVLKYRRLELALPESGLIAISGPNESGKSSIGEAVCFALFGRTFSIGPDELDKVVRWGETHCAVTLDFTVDGTAWELSRMLDRDGNHGARLQRIGESEPEARGVRAVADRLVELIGFEYEQFVESFYLAQREITTPHPHSQAVKIMAGIAPLETVEREIEDEIGERRELIEEVQAELDSVRNDLDQLAVDPARLGELESERETLAARIEETDRCIEAVRSGADDYAEAVRAAYRAQGARSRAAFFRFVFLLLAAACGGLWWLLGEGATLPPADTVRGWLDAFVPRYRELPHQAWLWGAAGFGALFLLAWMRVAGRRRAVRRLHAEAAALAEPLRAARAIDFEPGAEEPDAARDADETAETAVAGEDADAAAGEAAEDETPVTRADEAAFERLVERVERARATVRQVREYVETELAWLERARAAMASRLEALDAEIEAEQGRLREAAHLREVIEGLRAQREEAEERIRLRETAVELLEGAIGTLSANFNRDIKDLVARLLPRFTDGRYEHLQIDQDLGVRVFSAEKRDFMDLEEVSSGTQRQIMLALRLALSQKLLARKVRGRQFAFLDEPFAFFDEERTRRALGALAELGEDISQVWIVAQSFPEDGGVAFDVHVECRRGQDELVLGVE